MLSHVEMRNKITDSLNNPEALEALYRQDPRQFSVWHREAMALQPQSETLRVWQARLTFSSPAAQRKGSTPLLFVVALSLLAGILTKLPRFTGMNDNWFYPRFVPIIVVAALIAYFLRQHSSVAVQKKAAAALLSCTVFAAILPDDPRSASIIMSQVHLPLVLGSLLALVFMADEWRAPEARLRYIRYLGEVLIYSTLILIGGMVLTFITLGLFSLIGSSIKNWYLEYVVVFGLVASPIVATYLYESVLGSDSKVATLLSNVFAPLFLITVIVYLIAILLERRNPYSDRDFLIVFNGLLVVIWGICVFSIAGRKRDAATGPMDYVNVALMAVTLIINAVALSAILFRWSEGGTTPNRVAVTGANVLIFAHLLLILRQYVYQLRRRTSPASLRATVANYLPLYSCWSLFVAVGLPVLFWFE